MKHVLSLKNLWLPVLALSLLALPGCQKNDENPEQNLLEEQDSQISSESDGEADALFNDVFDDVMGVNDEVGLGGTGIFGRPTNCPVVTVTRLGAGTAFPVRITMDFGATGCVGRDGRTRRGKIITTYTNRLIMPGAIATTNFDGYYVDSIKVEGAHKITNTGSGQIGNPPAFQYTVTVTDGKLTRPSGNFIEWNSNKVITQVEGMITNMPVDDIFRIEGSSRGRVSRNGRLSLFESNVIEPLMKKFTCRWIVRGKIRTVRVNATAPSAWIAALDFGTGTCDNLASITINGVTRQITLP
jgi:hypothetical protein